MTSSKSKFTSKRDFFLSSQKQKKLFDHFLSIKLLHKSQVFLQNLIQLTKLYKALKLLGKEFAFVSSQRKHYTT